MIKERNNQRYGALQNKVPEGILIVLTEEDIEKAKETIDPFVGLSADILAVPQKYEEVFEKEEVYKELRYMLARSKINKVIYY